MSRQPWQQQYAAPGARPWVGRAAGGVHPLAGAAAAAPAAEPGPAASWRVPQGRQAAAARPASVPVPIFGPGMGAIQLPAPVPDLQQTMSRLAAAAAEPAPPGQHPPPYSQTPIGSQHAAFAPFSQRSQLDNIQLTQPQLTQPQQPEEDYGAQHGHVAVPIDAAVGSAPQPVAAAGAYDDGRVVPSQPEVTRQQRLAPRETATNVLRMIEQRKSALALVGERASEELLTQLSAIGRKLDVLDGGQAGTAVAVVRLQEDLADQGRALGGLGRTCAELAQAIQMIAGTTSGIEGRLQALLAKPAVVTGDMGIQTSPALASVAAAAIQTSPALAGVTAAGIQVSPSLLHAFIQRRPSSANRKLSTTAPSPAAAAPRGLRAAVLTGAAVLPPPAKPTTSTLAAAAAPSLAQEQALKPATVVAAAAVPPEPLPSRAGTSKRSCMRKGRLPAETATAAGTAVTPPKPQRRASGSRKRPAEAEAPRAALRPMQVGAPALGTSKAACHAEVLFDSLFDSEAAEAEAVPPAQTLAAAPLAAAAPDVSELDMAAAVQRRLEKHRARFTRRRRSASQRQEESEDA